ncbi:hypothetical protein GQ457_11G028440 [Hibiscus cannabinus]
MHLQEDALVLRDLGVDAYRFSIPWTRILPNGTLSGGINQEGIDHYNTLIDELIKIGVKPFVTLLHFDLPQALEDKYGTYLNRSIVEDFKNYAEICFKAYGDRVKHWITINEPFIVAKYGYTAGNAPPGRCSDRRECAFGNSATEPYIAIHNLLLAHATAARLYKDKYQVEQGGVIGMSNVAQYYEPYSYTLADRKAARRAMEFDLGWFMEPLVRGQYPPIMQKLVKDRLSVFTEEDKELIKGSFDFIGLNYYTSRYSKNIPTYPRGAPLSLFTDPRVNITAEKNGVLIGPKAEGSGILYIYPRGLYKILNFVKKHYGEDIAIYISENGVSQKRNGIIPINQVLSDEHRIEYVQKHLQQISKAIERKHSHGVPQEKVHQNENKFDNFPATGKTGEGGYPKEADVESSSNLQGMPLDEKPVAEAKTHKEALRRIHGHVEEESLWKLSKSLIGTMALDCNTEEVKRRLHNWGLGDFVVKKMGGRRRQSIGIDEAINAVCLGKSSHDYANSVDKGASRSLGVPELVGGRFEALSGDNVSAGSSIREKGAVSSKIICVDCSLNVPGPKGDISQTQLLQNREGSSSSQSEVEKEDLAADFIPEDFNLRRDRALRRIRKKNSEKTTLEIGETSLSSSDMRFRREVLIREARNTIEFGKQIGFQVEGDSEEAVLDMVREDFENYAEICFKAYGDRVKHWITINEPFIVAKYGYTAGNAPPGRCSDRRECAFGNSATEPYIAIHNLLLAHATAARLYKDKYQAEQGGVIGMSNVAQYYEPYSNKLADRKAARRAMEFDLGWFMEPLVRGQYPPIMQKLVKDRLPVFTEEDKELIKGSFDFIGLNYYTSRYSKNIPTYPRGAPLSLFTDPRVNITGISQKRNDIIPINQVLSDEHRIEYVQKHLQQISKAIEEDFKNYAEICFKAYGDRVKHWITINEPFIVAKYGYTAGNAPPGRCSDRRECAFGNSATEPYIAIHNLLLAHATAARLYKDKYQVTIMPQNFIGWNMNFGFLKWLNLGQQAEQGGVIGMSNVAQYYEPYSYTLADRKAARRAMEFDLGWSVKPHLFSIQQFILKNPKPMDTICVIFSRFMEPLVRGQYPPIMQKLVKDRLPVFTEEDKELIKGSFDFIGLNYYTSRYSKNIPTYPRGAPLSLFTDPRVNITAEKNGVLIGPKAEGSGILYIYPRGLYKILNFVKKHYGEDIAIYISENGVSQKRNDIIPINQVLSDEHRIEYVQKHLQQISKAIE